jgi:hypothetical protein
MTVVERLSGAAIVLLLTFVNYRFRAEERCRLSLTAT